MPKIFDEYSRDTGFESRVLDAHEHCAIDGISEVDDILNFPAMLVSGRAGMKLKKLIGSRLFSDRTSVKALRFANTDIPDDPLKNLPTIHFQRCSGLETTLPVVIDSLISNYIDKICPRTVFSKVFSEYKKDLLPTESSMLSKALCTIYTVVTRCRGPLIWLETFPAEEHPLIKRLKVVMDEYKIKLSFIGDKDTDQITDQFITHLFNSGIGDIEDINFAWEESIRLFLFNVRSDLWACEKEYGEQLHLLRKSLDTGAFRANDKLPSMARLRENSDLLCNALKSCGFPAAVDLSHVVQSFEVLFKIHLGNWVGFLLSVSNSFMIGCKLE